MPSFEVPNENSAEVWCLPNYVRSPTKIMDVCLFSQKCIMYCLLKKCKAGSFCFVFVSQSLIAHCICALCETRPATIIYGCVHNTLCCDVYVCNTLCMRCTVYTLISSLVMRLSSRANSSHFFRGSLVSRTPFTSVAER